MNGSGVAMGAKRNWNALSDDPDWCGHLLASLRTWTCADCDRPLTEGTKARLLAAPTKAPDGSVWVLLRGDQDHMGEDGLIVGYVTGLYADRAAIARSLVRERIYSADDIRAAMRRIHWYQGVFNAAIFEGWAEEEGAVGGCDVYELSLEKVHP